MPERFHENETLLILIVALVAPPVAVFLMRGCGYEVLICFLLGLLFFFPGQIYAFCLVAEHARQLKQKTAKPMAVVETPAKSTKSNVDQVAPVAPPPVVQTIEYKPPSTAPPPPTPASPTPAAPAPTPAAAPPTVTEQVVVVTKSPDKAPEKAPEAPAVVPPAAAAK
ncbi:hypothetical protein KCU65_g5385, partial [Aureobasidium melanogenum]